MNDVLRMETTGALALFELGSCAKEQKDLLARCYDEITKAEETGRNNFYKCLNCGGKLSWIARLHRRHTHYRCPPSVVKQDLAFRRMRFDLYSEAQYFYGPQFNVSSFRESLTSSDATRIQRQIDYLKQLRRQMTLVGICPFCNQPTFQHKTERIEVDRNSFHKITRQFVEAICDQCRIWAFMGNSG